MAGVAAEPVSRARAVLRAVAGASAALAPDAGPLALGLADALAAPPVDFAEVARQWAALAEMQGVRPETRRLLAHLAARQRPPLPGDHLASMVGLPLGLPVALATFRSPRDLLGTAYHAARLTTADEHLTWGTVGIGVAAARFLLGKVDFIPDVIEALAVNDAPAGLLDAIRRVPVLPPSPERGEPRWPEDRGSRAVVAALWAAYRCPAGDGTVAWFDRAGIREDAAVAAAGLLAARDGEPRIPRAWLPAGVERQRCDDLAARLAGPHPSGAQE